MGGHQLLVGGDHALARLQRPAGKVQGHTGPADGLHHDVHLGVSLDHGKVLHETVRERAVREVPHIQDIFQLDKVVKLTGDAVLMSRQHLGHTGPDSAKA